MVELITTLDANGNKILDLSAYQTEDEKKDAINQYKQQHADQYNSSLSKNWLIRQGQRLGNSIKDVYTGGETFITKETVDKSQISYWEDYYSGCDVGVLIGDYLVDDVVTIQYTLTNNKSPIYGYMSENFDAVAKGTRVVQGQFAVAFKEVGYLNKILEQYEKTGTNLDFTKDKFKSLTSDDISNFKLNGKIPGADGITEKDFSDEEIKVLNGGFKSPDKFGYTKTYVKRAGFDIIVSFGDVSESNRGGTIEIINNCHITSRSLVCEPTGDPIAEVFSFFGRGLNEYVPKYTYAPQPETYDASGSALGPQPVPQGLNTRYIPWDLYVATYQYKGDEYLIGTEELNAITNQMLPGKYAIVKTSRSDIGYDPSLFADADTKSKLDLQNLDTQFNITDNSSRLNPISLNTPGKTLGLNYKF